MNYMFVGLAINPDKKVDTNNGDLGWTLIDFTGGSGTAQDAAHQPAAVFDIDGTISDTSKRVKYLNDKDQKGWDKFYDEAKNDDFKPFPCGDLKGMWETGAQIILMTGRPDKYLFDTIRWLHEMNLLQYISSMYMRHSNNFEPASDLKISMIGALAKAGVTIVRFYDDDKKVRDAISEFGIEVIDPDMIGRQKLIIPT